MTYFIAGLFCPDMPTTLSGSKRVSWASPTAAKAAL
jgi:hypothetical protein